MLKQKVNLEPLKVLLNLQEDFLYNYSALVSGIEQNSQSPPFPHPPTKKSLSWSQAIPGWKSFEILIVVSIVYHIKMVIYDPRLKR